MPCVRASEKKQSPRPRTMRLVVAVLAVPAVLEVAAMMTTTQLVQASESRLRLRLPLRLRFWTSCVLWAAIQTPPLAEEPRWAIKEATAGVVVQPPLSPLAPSSWTRLFSTSANTTFSLGSRCCPQTLSSSSTRRTPSEWKPSRRMAKRWPMPLRLMMVGVEAEAMVVALVLAVAVAVALPVAS